MSKLTIWIFTVTQIVVLAMSAKLLITDGMLGIGVTGLVLCVMSTWAFKVIEVMLQDLKETA